ncbi:MAG: carbohydrate binding domain-containing protein [Anaerolineae bacterium]|nr:carbohydrate binding domain-containing protein [Anaerolineae bacterium]
MKKTAHLLVVTLVVVLLGARAASLRAAPAQQGNLLQNPGFEQPFSGGAAGNWQTWSRSTPRSDDACLVAYHVLPKWNVETAAGFVREGTASQYVGNNWDTWSGGVYQTVAATPGTTYRFSFYGRGRGSNESSPAASETALQMNMRAGIDPNGSGPWNDADVVWGAAGSPHDAWQQFTVSATATGNQITVFTGADWGVTGVNQCRQFLDTWVDAAELAAQTPPPATAAPTQPPPTPAPVQTSGVPTEPAAATLAATLAAATATTTPTGTATVCVNAFLDANGNGLRDTDEGYVAGVTLTVAQGATVIGQAVSTGQAEPLCFGNLAAGTFQVGQTLPPTLETTTQPNATVDVAAGQTVALEFGSRLRTTPTAPPPTATADPAQAAATATAAATAAGAAEGGSNWLVYLGLGAILVGVALLGALLFTLLRR